MKEQILNYIRGGLSVVPIVEGEKRCALPAHNPEKHPCSECPHFFQYERLAKEEEVNRWFGRNIRSWGVYNGSISGNCVGFDFECHTDPTIYDRWYARLSDEQRMVVDTLVIDKSRRGGRHVFCRTETTKISTVFAARPTGDPKKPKEVLIEIRGSGSLLLIPPSSGYETLQGDLCSVPKISDDMFEELADVARSLNECIEEKEVDNPIEYIPADPTSTKPGDIFNREGDWEFLKEYGWLEAYKDHWTRPGKDAGDGISATTNWKGFPMLYCFSSNAEPFRANKGYSRFSCLTMLKFGGDASACAGYLSSLSSSQSVSFPDAVIKQQEEGKGFPPPMSFSELITKDFPKAQFVLEPFFEKGALNMISAPPNNWKSWLILLMAERIATGNNFLDKFGTEKTNIMIVNEEDSANSIQSRFKSLKITEEGLPIYFHIMQGIKIEEKSELILKQAKDRGVGVIMFDSLRAIHNAEENSSSEMQKILDQFKKFTKENITVIFTHHHRKKNGFIKGDDAEASRGSTAINAALSGHISLEEDNRETEKVLIVRHLKSKVGEKLQPFEIKIVKEEDGTMKFTYDGDLKTIERKLAQTKSKIMYGFSSEPAKWRTAKDFLNVAGKHTVRTALKVLIDEGSLKSILRSEAVARNIRLDSEGPKNEIVYKMVEEEESEVINEEFNF